MSETSEPTERAFGVGMSRRWAAPVKRHRLRGTGKVVVGTRSFAANVGRSLSSRVAIRSNLTASQASRPSPSPQGGPTGEVMPPLPVPMTALMRAWRWTQPDDEAVTAGAPREAQAQWPPAALSRALPTLAAKLPNRGPAALPAPTGAPSRELAFEAPLGLPRVTRRGARTPAGSATGPSGGSNRIAPQQARVRQPQEVSAVGPTLTRRDAGRTARRSTPGRGSSSSDTAASPGPAGRPALPRPGDTGVRPLAAAASAATVVARASLSLPRHVAAPAAVPAGAVLRRSAAAGLSRRPARIASAGSLGPGVGAGIHPGGVLLPGPYQIGAVVGRRRADEAQVAGAAGLLPSPRGSRPVDRPIDAIAAAGRTGVGAVGRRAEVAGTIQGTEVGAVGRPVMAAPAQRVFSPDVSSSDAPAASRPDAPSGGAPGWSRTGAIPDVRRLGAVPIPVASRLIVRRAHDGSFGDVVAGGASERGASAGAAGPMHAPGPLASGLHVRLPSRIIRAAALVEPAVVASARSGPGSRRPVAPPTPATRAAQAERAAGPREHRADRSAGTASKALRRTPQQPAPRAAVRPPMIGRDFSADRVATPLGGSAGASWRNAAPVPPGRIVIRRSPAGVPGAPGESSRPAAGMVLGGPEPALPGREPGTVGRASSSRGERFLKTLALRRPDADRPLPVQLRPLADLVVGPAAAASVRVRTGPSTQAALAAAERPAATVGNVIHLDSPPTTAQRSVEILAHELVHASKPSPVARFLDDDRDSAEERQAARTALSVKSLIQAFEARSDAGSRGGAGHLTLGTAGLAVAPGASPLTAGAVGQLIAGRHNRGGGTGGAGSSTGAATVPAPTGGSAPSATGGTDAGMHRGRRNTGRHRPGSPTPGTGTGVPGDYLSELPPAVASLIANDRFDTPAFGGAPPFPGGVPSMPQPGFQPGYPPIPGRLPVGPILGGAMSGTSTAGPLVDQSVTPMSEETLDWIVEAVEERVLAELERRGIRFQPEVF